LKSIFNMRECREMAERMTDAKDRRFHEIKHDDFRITARRDSLGVRLITGNGHDFSARLRWSLGRLAEGQEPGSAGCAA
jgi:ATP-dependent DNA ligase